MIALLPRSLAGRIFLIIIAGLVVAHVASYAFFEIERARVIDRFTAAEAAARIIETARPTASSTAPPHERGFAMREQARWREVDDLGAAAIGEAQPSAGFQRELRRVLAENFGEDPVEWLTLGAMEARPRARAAIGRPGFERRAPHLLTVALRIPGRSPAIAEVPVFMPPARGIPPDAWLPIALVFVVTALFSLWAARIAVRPVRMLADAADRFSRNLAEPPLAERGATEIRAASRAFNRMQDRLARHVNNRALAFAAMSHDMRTPLTRMRLRLESVDGGAARALGEDVDEIESLANSALEMTRGLAPDEGLVPVDVERMLHALAESFLPMGVRVPIGGRCAPISARPNALRRAFGNLIDNAIKYGREVEIRIEDTRAELRVSVLDRGPGIPADDLLKVVYPFYRVESSRNRETGGTGLGLAIAKDIVEGHGGELVIANREGGGLQVTVRLPR